MTGRRRRVLAVAVVVAFVAGFVVVLAQRGAGAVRSIAVDSRPGVPAGAALTSDGSGGVVREDGLVDVWVGGSSSCPWVPVSVELDGRTLRVTVDDPTPAGTACTADMAFTTHTVRPPRALDPDTTVVEVVAADQA
ncbi:hypothetical protein [Cellulomonas hominis]|uniref:hypothetical protein n=1 Tax=Cellulomonas hominis TaxID=156981 RepID=UPI001B912BE1|nr:hypothetical protein [Cellulomonas hominis]VTR78868.1 hypothetical protein CHMI_03654 [Cellulomonas hominis]